MAPGFELAAWLKETHTPSIRPRVLCDLNEQIAKVGWSTPGFFRREPLDRRDSCSARARVLRRYGIPRQAALRRMGPTEGTADPERGRHRAKWPWPPCGRSAPARPGMSIRR